MIKRMIILSVCLLAGSAIVAAASRTENIPARQKLGSFPYGVGAFMGRDTQPLTAQVLAVLGADDHLSRAYATPGRGYIGLFIAYYESQRQGDTIHSPLNCLPGAGWQPLSRSYLTIPIARADGTTTDITVNKYLIEKGLDRQVVLYWYQSHGRVVANEYRSKIFMVYDAVKLNRSDAAMVRVTIPLVGSEADADAQATERVVTFVQQMFPLLEEYVPS